MPVETLQKIMIVEDDDDIQDIAKMALDSVGGFSVELCSTGAEALEKVGKIKPQLILLDVSMPQMDGPSILRKLREDSETASIPVVFLTSNNHSDEIAAYKKIGAFDVISKPFDPVMLPEIVLNIWKRITK